MTSHQSLNPADEQMRVNKTGALQLKCCDPACGPYSWQTTQVCNRIFKGPLQTLLICRPKRLIRQGSERQTGGVVNARAPLQPVESRMHTSLSWRALPAWGDYICEFPSSWQLPHRCFSSIQLWNTLVLQSHCGKIINLSVDKNALRNIAEIPNTVRSPR